MLMIKPHSSGLRFRAATSDVSNLFVSQSGMFVSRNRYRRCDRGVKSGGSGIRVAAAKKDRSSSDSGPVKQNAKPQRYHPSEDIDESHLLVNGEAKLTPAETTRTIIEVNTKATLMFSGVVNDDIHQNIFWPDLAYVTDEHGNIYFQVKNDEDIIQTLTSEETTVQVIIGLDIAEMISEMEALGHSEFDFHTDEFDNEDSAFDVDEDEDEDGNIDDDNEDEDNYDKEWVAIVNEEDRDDQSGWAKLETMRSSHPIYFAKKLAEVVSDDPVDYMEQPSAGLAIQGLLRPALIEEHSIIQKHVSDSEYSDADDNGEVQLQDENVHINGFRHGKERAQYPNQSEEFEKDETGGNGFAFYKLEMIKIQLASSNGHQSYVEMEDFRRAQPDAIAHSAANIISRIKDGGEKTMRALKSLCWRCKGIQVEECILIGVDTLGFDLRVCSGTQVQTLRFTFKKRASSEYSAERQLNNLLFPRAKRVQQKKEAKQTEA